MIVKNKYTGIHPQAEYFTIKKRKYYCKMRHYIISKMENLLR